MKQFIALLLGVFITTLLASCSEPVDIANLQFIQENETVEVYRGGNPFDGEASNQDRSFRVYAEDGQLQDITYWEYRRPLIIEHNNRVTYYNRQGDSISNAKFKVLYPNAAKRYDSLRSYYIQQRIEILTNR